MNEVTPAPKTILVEPVSFAETKTAGGIYLMEKNDSPDKVREGIIKAIGVDPEKFHTYAVGDHVLYKSYGGVPFLRGGKEMIFLDLTDVLGTVKQES